MPQLTDNPDVLSLSNLLQNHTQCIQTINSHSLSTCVRSERLVRQTNEIPDLPGRHIYIQHHHGQYLHLLTNSHILGHLCYSVRPMHQCPRLLVCFIALQHPLRKSDASICPRTNLDPSKPFSTTNPSTPTENQSHNRPRIRCLYSHHSNSSRHNTRPSSSTGR